MIDAQQVSVLVALAVGAFAIAARRARLQGDDERSIAFQSGLELVVDDGRGERAISTGRIALIGRAPNADVRLAEPQVSRLHARIEARNDGVFVEDLGSRNGTACNGEPVMAPTRIEPGDELLIGNARVVFAGIGTWR